MQLTPTRVLADLQTLPENYKTKDVDNLIKRYVSEKADTSLLRPYILKQQELLRIYFFVSLKQMKKVEDRMAFIHQNLLFEDWWHTDILINFVSDMDFDAAMGYAKNYVADEDAFIRRWGYVLFISKLGHHHADEILPLLKDDDHYYVQMAQAWLLAELAVFEPEKVYVFLKNCDMKYNITGKAVQKMCDSFRITKEWKEKFKQLRPLLKCK